MSMPMSMPMPMPIPGNAGGKGLPRAALASTKPESLTVWFICHSLMDPTSAKCNFNICEMQISVLSTFLPVHTHNLQWFPPEDYSSIYEYVECFLLLLPDCFLVSPIAPHRTPPHLASLEFHSLAMPNATGYLMFGWCAFAVTHVFCQWHLLTTVYNADASLQCMSLNNCAFVHLSIWAFEHLSIWHLSIWAIEHLSIWAFGIWAFGIHDLWAFHMYVMLNHNTIAATAKLPLQIPFYCLLTDYTIWNSQLTLLAVDMYVSRWQLLRHQAPLCMALCDHMKRQYKDLARFCNIHPCRAVYCGGQIEVSLRTKCQVPKCQMHKC